MSGQNNPCLTCYFDWKDYCSDEKRKSCIEKQMAEKDVVTMVNKTNIKKGVKHN